MSSISYIFITVSDIAHINSMLVESYIVHNTNSPGAKNNK
jgi:hypothetical protein